MIRYSELTDLTTAEKKAETLLEAFPYLHRLSGSKMVIKVGGELVMNQVTLAQFAQDIALLSAVGIKVVVCHGGGPQITELMQALHLEPKFIDGQRVTDEKTLEVTQMVLVGKVQQAIVSQINKFGSRAIGLSGIDASILRVQQARASLGLVGEIELVTCDPIERLLEGKYIPVISSLGTDGKGGIFNLNADLAAGKIAEALKAEKLVFLTNVEGLYEDFEKRESLISEIDSTTLQQLKDKGHFNTGMIPKVEAVLCAIDGGVPHVHVLDGRRPHALLLEVFTHKGIGTMIFAS